MWTCFFGGCGGRSRSGLAGSIRHVALPSGPGTRWSPGARPSGCGNWRGKQGSRETTRGDRRTVPREGWRGRAGRERREAEDSADGRIRPIGGGLLAESAEVQKRSLLVRDAGDRSVFVSSLNHGGTEIGAYRCRTGSRAGPGGGCKGSHPLPAGGLAVERCLKE